MTPHFTKEELTRSVVAERNGIDNSIPDALLPNLNRLAEGLEQVRSLLGDRPLLISSGYRCPRLNARVGGAASSAHMAGYAADFTCAKFGTPQEIVRAIASSSIQYDKLINEQNWVHISFDSRNRRQNIIASFARGAVSYKDGLE